MSGLVADTHSTIWFLANAPELSYVAREQMLNALVAGKRIYISAITLVEMVYLVEKKRIPRRALDRLLNFVADPTSGFVVAPVTVSVAQTLQQISREDIPDMPDRIIAATALNLLLPLVTKDARIRAAKIETVW